MSQDKFNRPFDLFSIRIPFYVGVAVGRFVFFSSSSLFLSGIRSFNLKNCYRVQHTSTFELVYGILLVCILYIHISFIPDFHSLDLQIVYI